MPRQPLVSFPGALASVFGGTAAPPVAQADAIKGFFFKLRRGTPAVEGVYAVGGYTTAEMVSMMGKYCAGGIPERFKGSTLAIEIEDITEGEYAGQHLVEITGSDELGNMISTRGTRSRVLPRPGSLTQFPDCAKISP